MARPSLACHIKSSSSRSKSSSGSSSSNRSHSISMYSQGDHRIYSHRIRRRGIHDGRYRIRSMGGDISSAAHTLIRNDIDGNNPANTTTRTQAHACTCHSTAHAHKISEQSQRGRVPLLSRHSRTASLCSSFSSQRVRHTRRRVLPSWDTCTVSGQRGLCESPQRAEQLNRLSPITCKQTLVQRARSACNENKTDTRSAHSTGAHYHTLCYAQACSPVVTVSSSTRPRHFRPDESMTSTRPTRWSLPHGLPHDVFRAICAYLDESDYRVLLEVSRALYRLVGDADAALWRPLCLRAWVNRQGMQDGVMHVMWTEMQQKQQAWMDVMTQQHTLRRQQEHEQREQEQGGHGRSKKQNYMGVVVPVCHSAQTGTSLRHEGEDVSDDWTDEDAEDAPSDIAVSLNKASLAMSEAAEAEALAMPAIPVHRSSSEVWVCCLRESAHLVTRHRLRGKYARPNGKRKARGAGECVDAREESDSHDSVDRVEAARCRRGGLSEATHYKDTDDGVDADIRKDESAPLVVMHSVNDDRVLVVEGGVHNVNDTAEQSEECNGLSVCHESQPPYQAGKGEEEVTLSLSTGLPVALHRSLTTPRSVECADKENEKVVLSARAETWEACAALHASSPPGGAVSSKEGLTPRRRRKKCSNTNNNNNNNNSNIEANETGVTSPTQRRIGFDLEMLCPASYHPNQRHTRQRYRQPRRRRRQATHACSHGKHHHHHRKHAHRRKQHHGTQRRRSSSQRQRNRSRQAAPRSGSCEGAPDRPNAFNTSLAKNNNHNNNDNNNKHRHASLHHRHSSRRRRGGVGEGPTRSARRRQRRRRGLAHDSLSPPKPNSVVKTSATYAAIQSNAAVVRACAQLPPVRVSATSREQAPCIVWSALSGDYKSDSSSRAAQAASSAADVATGSQNASRSHLCENSASSARTHGAERMCASQQAGQGGSCSAESVRDAHNITPPPTRSSVVTEHTRAPDINEAATRIEHENSARQAQRAGVQRGDERAVTAVVTQPTCTLVAASPQSEMNACWQQGSVHTATTHAEGCVKAAHDSLALKRTMHDKSAAAAAETNVRCNLYWWQLSPQTRLRHLQYMQQNQQRLEHGRDSVPHAPSQSHGCAHHRDDDGLVDRVSGVTISRTPSSRRSHSRGSAHYSASTNSRTHASRSRSRTGSEPRASPSSLASLPSALVLPAVQHCTRRTAAAVAREGGGMHRHRCGRCMTLTQALRRAWRSRRQRWGVHVHRARTRAHKKESALVEPIKQEYDCALNHATDTDKDETAWHMSRTPPEAEMSWKFAYYMSMRESRRSLLTLQDFLDGVWVVCFRATGAVYPIHFLPNQTLVIGTTALPKKGRPTHRPSGDDGGAGGGSGIAAENVVRCQAGAHSPALRFHILQGGAQLVVDNFPPLRVTRRRVLDKQYEANHTPSRAPIMPPRRFEPTASCPDSPTFTSDALFHAEPQHTLMCFHAAMNAARRRVCAACRAHGEPPVRCNTHRRLDSREPKVLCAACVLEQMMHAPSPLGNELEVQPQDNNNDVWTAATEGDENENSYNCTYCSTNRACRVKDDKKRNEEAHGMCDGELDEEDEDDYDDENAPAAWCRGCGDAMRRCARAVFNPNEDGGWTLYNSHVKIFSLEVHAPLYVDRLPLVNGYNACHDEEASCG